ncbi:hypothetical protein [Intestinibacter sp.]|uniref:hypothetical protein n=1 Tax=Intestinibacter sp. TaxID=1965304 RepID=UPI003F154670
MTRYEALQKTLEIIKKYPDIQEDLKEIVDALLSPPWIGVNEELPYIYADMVTSSGDRTELVAVKREDGTQDYGYMVYKDKWYWVTESNSDSPVAYWMFI